jgi:hypothetical protein
MIAVQCPAQDCDNSAAGIDYATSAELMPGSTLQMEILAAFPGGTSGDFVTYNRHTIYKSLNQSIVKVSEFGEVFGISTGTAVIEIRHGETSTSAEVTVLNPDSSAPISQLFFSGKTFINSAGIIHTSSESYAEISSTDPFIPGNYTMEISVVNYSVDMPAVSAADQLEELYTKTIKLSEGHHTIQFAAIDYSGNMEPVQTNKIYIDATPPGPPKKAAANTVSRNNRSKAETYKVSWINPADPSGIAGARVKYGEVAPKSNEEGTFYHLSRPSLHLPAETGTAAHILWLWLEDNVGNADPTTAIRIKLKP